MDLIHFILNAAAVLLWLSWRSHRFVPAAEFRGGTLLSTLKKTEKGRFNRHILLGSLAAILILRAFVYAIVGAAVSWTPRLDLVVISIPFRSDYLDRMFLFSMCSFGLWIAVLHFWLMFLQAVNHRSAESNPWQAIIRKNLGVIGGLPVYVRIFLPALVAFLAWLVLSKYFSYLRIIPEPLSQKFWLEQAGIMALAVYLTLKGAVVIVLGLHLLNSYVYLGNYPIWAYVNVSAQNILKPLRWLPLQFGKVDVTPLVMMVLVLLADHFLRHGWHGEYGLIALYRQVSV